MIALPLIYAPFAYGIYASIAFYRKIRLDDVESWKKACITTNLSAHEFILISQNLCANKGYQLMDISIVSNELVKVVIKENPSLWWWNGQIYYIEYKAVERPEVVLYARGCVFKKNLNLSSYKNTLYSFMRI
jgi:hypothetical protein